MKKAITFAILFICVFLLGGCGKQQTSQNQPNTPVPEIIPAVQQPVKENGIEQNQTQNTPEQPAQQESIIYKNTAYGFELTFPDTWKEYNASKRTLDWGSVGTCDSYDFGLPAQKDGLFNISVLTIKQWNDLKTQEGPIPTYLGENKTDVFAWAQAQYAADGNMEKRMAEVQSIVKTFKLSE